MQVHQAIERISSCGIMCRMDEKAFEETQPMRQNPAPLTPPSDEGDNIPIVHSSDTDTGGMDNSSGLNQTMPTPIERGLNRSPVSSGMEGETSVDIDAGSTLQKASLSKNPPESTHQPGAPSNTGKRNLSWMVFPILGLIVLGLIAIISALGGYLSGISLRKNAETTQVALAVQEQYQIGLQEMEQGEFRRAQQRFEYVIQLDPNYPGVTEKLSEVLLQLNTTATSTLLPTSTITPTPDTRDNQELYDQGQQYLLNKEWKNAIDTFLSLRKADPTFRTVDIDGMLFLALRNQGVDKILKEADLEGGIYDLTLASHFGPLDAEAQGFLNWTGLYITGASFWDIDWEQAVNYFSQVAPQLPNLRDGSGMTATERLRIALYEYGNVLARQGQACRALQLYKQSLAIAPDSQVEQAAALAEKGCSGGGETQTGKTPKPGKKTPVP
jgi:tetratricopeptide (TPR) repeat protein